MQALSLSDKPLHLAGTRLLLPLVSLGSVPQLAVDLLVASLQLERVAYLSSHHHVPILGALDTNRPSLTGVSTPIEIFQDPARSLTLILQRSPPLKSHKDDFIHDLVDFVRQSQFSAVLLLGSMDAATRRDADLQSTGPLRHLLFSASPSTPLSSSLASFCPLHTSSTSSEAIPLIAAGGLTRRLVTALREGETIDGGALLAYVVEGDGRDDAHLLAGAVLHLLKLNEDKTIEWRQPRSWHAGLYGGPASTAQELFG